MKRSVSIPLKIKTGNPIYSFDLQYEKHCDILYFLYFSKGFCEYLWEIIKEKDSFKSCPEIRLSCSNLLNYRAYDIRDLLNNNISLLQFIRGDKSLQK